MRKIIIVAITAVATLLSVSGVAAASPERGSFDGGFNSFVDTEVCAAAPWQFDVNATEHEYGSFLVFFNADGSFDRAIVHLNYDATISANGNTIVERDTWTFFVNRDGSRDVGLTVHIQGPGGIVVRDAGQIVRDAEGNPLYLRGPHEQFSGVSFCPALAG
ncbi:MAG: hypothetical protein ABJC39_10685 [Chloroflexota bacterium]